MTSLILSMVAFFIAAYFARRYLDDMDMPRGATRSVWIFCIAAAVSYLVAFVADWIGI